MRLSTEIYRRAKRDGRNPSTGAKSVIIDEPKEIIKEKSKKIKSESQPGD